MTKLLTFRRLLYVLLLAISLGILFQAVPFLEDRLVINTSDAGVIQGFIEWFGVLYGLIIAFVLVESWTNFNRVQEEVDKESDALQMLFWDARILGDLPSKPITEAIKKYTDLVLLARGHEEDREEIKEAIAELYHSVGALLKDCKNIPIGIELAKRLNEALDTRGDRLQHAESNIHPVLWGSLLINSVIWLTAFFGLAIDNTFVALWIVGSAVFVVVLLLYIISDMERPFRGVISVNFKPFEDLRKNLE